MVRQQAGTGSSPARAQLPALRGALAKTTPARLRLLLVGTVVACLVWGAVGAWTAAQRASAASDVVSASEPLSFDAQQIYRSLSDADATEATAFLAAVEPPTARARYLSDIATAAGYLEAATAGNQRVSTQLTVLAAGLPVYTGLVETARTDNQLGLPVGASYLEEASHFMRTKLLPAANAVYQQQNAQLAAADGEATALPVVAIVVALVVTCTLILTQRWLARRTRRLLNRGLLAASAIGLVSLAWLIAALFVARAQLSDARDHGSAPVQALMQANIAALRAHADESLTLINRSGDDANQTDFISMEKQLGPGPGTLLTAATAAADGSPGARPAAAAAAAAGPWYATHSKVRALDDGGNYDEAVLLAIGSGPITSGAMFQRVETALTSAIQADQAAFSTAASNGNDALAGLAAGMIVASLLMATACTWGLARRLAEYR